MENSNEKKINKSWIEKIKLALQNESVMQQNRLDLETKTNHKYKNNDVVNFLASKTFSR